MSSRYWVGNGGIISDTAHWSLSSGGVGGASEPTQTEDVIFDANSFTTSGQTVIGALGCKSLDCSAVTNNPTLFSSFIYTYGNITFGSNMSLPSNVFVDVSGNCNLISAGKFINILSLGDILTPNLTLNILDTLSVGQLQASGNNNTINTNDNTINCRSIIFNSTSGHLNLGASIITFASVDLNARSELSIGAVATVNAGTSKLIFEGNLLGFNFGLYSNSALILYDVEINRPYFKIGSVSVPVNDYTFHKLTVNPISGANFVRIAGSLLVSDSLSINGNSSYNRVLTNDIPATDPWNITAPSLTALNYCDITYMTALVNTIYAVDSVDSGNNINIIFGAPPPITGFNIFLGNAEVTSIYLGAVEITEAYLGSQTLK